MSFPPACPMAVRSRASPFSLPVREPAWRQPVSMSMNHAGRRLPARMDTHKERAASGLLFALFEAFEHRLDHAARREQRFAPCRAAVLATPPPLLHNLAPNAPSGCPAGYGACP